MDVRLKWTMLIAVLAPTSRNFVRSMRKVFSSTAVSREMAVILDITINIC